MEIYYKTGDVIVISKYSYFISYIQFIIFVHINQYNSITCIYVDGENLVVKPLHVVLNLFNDCEIHYMGICGKNIPVSKFTDLSNIYDHGMMWLLSGNNINNDLQIQCITKLLIHIGIKVNLNNIYNMDISEFVNNIDNILIDYYYIRFLIQ